MAEIQWYYVPETNPDLPHPQVLQDLEWDDWWLAPSEVGEVPDEPRSYNFPPPKPFARGLHLCGTAEDFAQGGEYLPDLPPVVRRPEDGLPECCGAVAAGAGGGAGGGAAEVQVVNEPVTGCDGYFVYISIEAWNLDREPPGPPWHWRPLTPPAAEPILYAPDYDPARPYWWVHRPSLSRVYRGPDLGDWDGEGVRVFTQIEPPPVGPPQTATVECAI